MIRNFSIPGFKTSSIEAGIKKEGPDVALFYSEVPSVAVGFFTKNSLKAISVKISEELLKKRGKIQAIIVNSGNANAATGKLGEIAAKDLIKNLSFYLGIDENLIISSSTGIIGEVLPSEKIVEKLPYLVRSLSRGGWEESARAIMTTDTRPKMAIEKFEIKSDKIVIGGVAKGAGMIQPSLATMLVFVFTNALIDRETLYHISFPAVEESFNRISVDGEMSTNDTVIIMASGFSRIRIRKRTKECRELREHLKSVLKSLALQIVDDGEGASHRIEIYVEGAKSKGEARTLAYRLATSPLLKAAIGGGDPNWGRIYAAAGAVISDLNQEELFIEIGGVPLYQWGTLPSKKDLKKAADKIREFVVPVKVILKRGRGDFNVYTTDLTCEYIKINADYHT